MPIKIFFSIQELKLKDDNALNLKISEEFDFTSMALSHGKNVKYLKHEVYCKSVEKWYLIITYQRSIEEERKLNPLPMTKYPRQIIQPENQK